MDRDAAFRVTVFSAGKVVGRVWPETSSLQHVPPAEWVVASANLTDHLRRAHEPIPEQWLEAARLAGPQVGALRLSDPVVYWTGPGAAIPPIPPALEGPHVGWTVRDTLDVGNPLDEGKHVYGHSGGT